MNRRGSGEEQQPFDDPNLFDGAEPILEFDPTELVVPVVRRLTYRFDGRASVEQTVQLATAIPVAFARTGQLVWIVPRTDGLSSTAGFRLECDNVSVVEDDPPLTFSFVPTRPRRPPRSGVSKSALRADRALLALGFVGTRAATSTTVNLSTVTPFFQTVALTAGFGPELSVTLRWVQGAVVASRDCLVTLSAYLMLRAQ